MSDKRDIVDGAAKAPAARPSSGRAVEAFLDAARKTPATIQGSGVRGRLLFCLDATASREPMWEIATRLQTDMFMAASALGGLDVRLAFYRGFNEFKATPWVSDPADLVRRMRGVQCVAGQTQVGRLLSFAAEETRSRKINAVAFVGDAFEENVDAVGHAAGQLGLLGVPVFVFQEGHDPVAEQAFRAVARLSGGAWSRFDAGSADQLRKLMGAVAAYAAGGRAAMLGYAKKEGGSALMLTQGFGGSGR